MCKPAEECLKNIFFSSENTLENKFEFHKVSEHLKEDGEMRLFAAKYKKEFRLLALIYFRLAPDVSP
jgi:hypothetical protein